MSTNPYSTRAHPKRIDQGGHFYDVGQFYVPLTLELTTSDSWRGLSPTGQRIALDMLFKFWRVSRGDTEVPPGGFCYTYHECNVDCGSTSFTNILKDIVARGLFTTLPGNRMVQRYKPGAWRDFNDPILRPLSTNAVEPARPKNRKKKKGLPCLEHFRREGDFFTRIYASMLQSDAWRNLSPTASAVLIDMLHTYNALTFSEFRELTEGMTYTFDQCHVKCCARTFNDARLEIIRMQWFTCPPGLQRDGKVFFLSGDWRSFVAPEAAMLRKKVNTKIAYVAMKQARGLNKTVCNKCDEEYAKSVTYRRPVNDVQYAKSVTQPTGNDQNRYAKSVTILDIPYGTGNQRRAQSGFHLFLPRLSSKPPLQIIRRLKFVHVGGISQKKDGND